MNTWPGRSGLSYIGVCEAASPIYSVYREEEDCVTFSRLPLPLFLLSPSTPLLQHPRPFSVPFSRVDIHVTEAGFLRLFGLPVFFLAELFLYENCNYDVAFIRERTPSSHDAIVRLQTSALPRAKGAGVDGGPQGQTQSIAQC